MFIGLQPLLLLVADQVTVFVVDKIETHIIIMSLFILHSLPLNQGKYITPNTFSNVIGYIFSKYSSCNPVLKRNVLEHCQQNTHCMPHFCAEIIYFFFSDHDMFQYQLEDIPQGLHDVNHYPISLLRLMSPLPSLLLLPCHVLRCANQLKHSVSIKVNRHVILMPR